MPNAKLEKLDEERRQEHGGDRHRGEPGDEHLGKHARKDELPLFVAAAQLSGDFLGDDQRAGETDHARGAQRRGKAPAVLEYFTQKDGSDKDAGDRGAENNEQRPEQIEDHARRRLGQPDVNGDHDREHDHAVRVAQRHDVRLDEAQLVKDDAEKQRHHKRMHGAAQQGRGLEAEPGDGERLGDVNVAGLPALGHRRDQFLPLGRADLPCRWAAFAGGETGLELFTLVQQAVGSDGNAEESLHRQQHRHEHADRRQSLGVGGLRHDQPRDDAARHRAGRRYRVLPADKRRRGQQDRAGPGAHAEERYRHRLPFLPQLAGVHHAAHLHHQQGDERRGHRHHLAVLEEG